MPASTERERVKQRERAEARAGAATYAAWVKLCFPEEVHEELLSIVPAMTGDDRSASRAAFRSCNRLYTFFAPFIDERIKEAEQRSSAN